jgi:hypothetical protein
MRGLDGERIKVLCCSCCCWTAHAQNSGLGKIPGTWPVGEAIPWSRKSPMLHERPKSANMFSL